MKKEEARLIFMGTPHISSVVFSSLIEDGFHFVGLISQPRKPVGRKKELLPTPCEEVAIKYNIPVFSPLKIRVDYDFVKDLKPDLIVTLAYGQIVPQGLLDIPSLGCVNFHGSLLPKYRGAAPIQYALIKGEKKTGFCLMEMLDKMDAGRVYSSFEIPITEGMNYSSLLDTLLVKLVPFAKDSLNDYLEGKLIGVPQDETKVSFAPSIKKEQEHLDLSLSKEEFINWIHALSMTPGGYLLNGEEKIKIFEAKIKSFDVKNSIGMITEMNKQGITLQLKDGELSLLTLQRPGKKVLSYKDFINGNHDLLGMILS